jgi:hypothetical protein
MALNVETCHRYSVFLHFMCVGMKLCYGFNPNSTRDHFRDETAREVVK